MTFTSENGMRIVLGYEGDVLLSKFFPRDAATQEPFALIRTRGQASSEVISVLKSALAQKE